MKSSVLPPFLMAPILAKTVTLARVQAMLMLDPMLSPGVGELSDLLTTMDTATVVCVHMHL